VPSPVHTTPASAVALAGALILVAAAPGGAARRIAPDPNPCIDPFRSAELLCPRISLYRPAHLKFDRKTHRGRLLLRAQNSINSVGEGPIEFRGTRSGPNTMAAVQRIYRRDGGWITVETGARLGFKSIPGQYRYWKFRDPLRFELWSVDETGHAKTRVRVGPKQYYCLRDLKRTNPGPLSPPRAHYPGCNQKKSAKRVTLGTSVGWSDIYPEGYHEQWIDVTGLHGRFVYRMVADPTGVIYTSDTTPVVADRLVRIP
jgi:hypothetical protein